MCGKYIFFWKTKVNLTKSNYIKCFLWLFECATFSIGFAESVEFGKRDDQSNGELDLFVPSTELLKLRLSNHICYVTHVMYNMFTMRMFIEKVNHVINK